MLLLLVLVHREKLLLLRVKQPHNVAALENFLLILPVLHEERHLPRRGRVDDVDLLAAGIVAQLVVCGHVETLPTRVHRLHDHLVADDDAVAVASQLVKRHYVEPGALVPVRVQVNPHRVLLQQRRQPLVHRQEFVGLEMQQLPYRERIDVNNGNARELNANLCACNRAAVNNVHRDVCVAERICAAANKLFIKFVQFHTISQHIRTIKHGV